VRKWTLTNPFTKLLFDSLLLMFVSLFPQKFSQLICIGNCAKSRCAAAVFCSRFRFYGAKIAQFPVKFPVSREFGWRRVRSTLRRQPGSAALGEALPDMRTKARKWRAFAIRRPVSVLPISQDVARIRLKSLASTGKIPVFGRRGLENGFDHHWVGMEALTFACLKVWPPPHAWCDVQTGLGFVVGIKRHLVAKFVFPETSLALVCSRLLMARAAGTNAFS
jgi:hypothetical protein